MKTRNLISSYQGGEVIISTNPFLLNDYHMPKKDEISTLHALCEILQAANCTSQDLDGYYVGYTIAQISAEFDLLRFGENYILNIEMKSQLPPDADTVILKQMQQHYYYLSALALPIKIFTYVKGVGLYHYDETEKKCAICEVSKIVSAIKNQRVNPDADPDKLFTPLKYLISPFNKTTSFLNDEYFLTDKQIEIKKDFFKHFEKHEMFFYTIPAHAGTGKTLLLYDIAKEAMSKEKKVTIIHCGSLNSGQKSLNQKNWKIFPIKAVSSKDTANQLVSSTDLLIIDEAHRILNGQLEWLITSAICSNVPILFAYDTNQYLKDSETLDISEHLKNNYGNTPCAQSSLTSKMRTNPDMASFIQNLMHFNPHKIKKETDYSHITINYFTNYEEAKQYTESLANNQWKAITFSTSVIYPERDPYRGLTQYSSITAHHVIGQEFEKVAVVLDNNFSFDQNKLIVRDSYYNAKGMLYQIVTRVINDLQIIVVNAPDLYMHLLEIKKMGDKGDF